MTRRPSVGTFHAAGDSTSYRVAQPRAELAGRPRSTCASRCRDDARELAERYLGGDYDGALQRGRGRPLPPRPARSPAPGRPIFFCGRHEPRKGLDVLLDAMAELPADVRLLGRRATGPTPATLQARFAGDPRIEWLGRISDEEKIARLRGGRRVLRAVAAAASRSASCCSRPWRPERRSWPSDLPGYRQRGPARRRRAARRRPGDTAALAAALERVLDRRRAGRRAARRRRRSGPRSSRWTASPSATSSSTSALVADRAPSRTANGRAGRPWHSEAGVRRRCSGSVMIVAHDHLVIVILVVIVVLVVLRRRSTTAWSACATRSRTPGRRSTCS